MNNDIAFEPYHSIPTLFLLSFLSFHIVVWQKMLQSIICEYYIVMRK
mgnify:CR=1 FL=1